MSDHGASGHFARSAESFAFERMWLDLPHNGTIPERQAFRPNLAKPFLRNILLAQAPSPGDPGLRIRVVGDAICEQVQGEIVGLDYLDFLEAEIHRIHVLDRIRELFTQPCGHNWVAPVHYERAFSQYWEITAFPLAADERNGAMVLGLVKPLDAIADGHRIGRRAVRIEPATQFEVIKIDRLPVEFETGAHW